MNFVHPSLLIVAAAMPVLAAVWSWLRLRREKALAKMGAMPAAGAAGLQSTAIVAGLILVAVAAARPRWGRAPEAVKAVFGRNLVIAIDVSRSMTAKDVHPDRLGRAKADAAELVDSLNGYNCALVAFRSDARLVSPLTADLAYVRRAIDSLDVDSAAPGETDLGAALAASLGALDPAADAQNAVILISDGGDLRGRALEYAALAERRGVPVFTVGIGDSVRGGEIPRRADRPAGEKVTVKLEQDALERIAKTSGGFYVQFGTAGTAETTLGRIYETCIERARSRELQLIDSRLAERYEWFLLPGFALLVFGALLSRGRPVRLRAAPRGRGKEC